MFNKLAWLAYRWAAVQEPPRLAWWVESELGRASVRGDSWPRPALAQLQLSHLVCLAHICAVLSTLATLGGSMTEQRQLDLGSSPYPSAQLWFQSTAPLAHIPAPPPVLLSLSHPRLSRTDMCWGWPGNCKSTVLGNRSLLKETQSNLSPIFCWYILRAKIQKEKKKKPKTYDSRILQQVWCVWTLPGNLH